MAEANGIEHDEAIHGLFSMVASDNAEVISQDAPRGPESMWSVAAKPADDETEVIPAAARERVAADPAGTPSERTSNDYGPNDYGSNGHDSNGHDTNGSVLTDESSATNGSGAASDAWSTGPAMNGSDSAGDAWSTGPAMNGSDPDGDAWWTGSSSESEGSADGSVPPPFNGWERSEPAWDTASSPFRRAAADPTGSIFSAEPIDHPDDVVDEADAVEDAGWEPAARPIEGSLFSNGAHLSNGPDGRRRAVVGDASGPVTDDPWVITDRRWDDSGVDWWDQAARPAPPGAGGAAAATGATGATGAQWADTDPPGPEPIDLDDPQGYETAILRLHPQDRERAHVPLSVCGALLHEDEVVLGVVTGQMLGRPAVVVVTKERVLVVNDRRWQPVVDIFPIDHELVVRGRHDRHVAALSFADPTRVSMVDGISEVLIAIELAGHIRDAGPRGQD